MPRKITQLYSTMDIEVQGRNVETHFSSDQTLLFERLENEMLHWGKQPLSNSAFVAQEPIFVIKLWITLEGSIIQPFPVGTSGYWSYTVIERVTLWTLQTKGFWNYLCGTGNTAMLVPDYRYQQWPWVVTVCLFLANITCDSEHNSIHFLNTGWTITKGFF